MAVQKDTFGIKVELETFAKLKEFQNQFKNGQVFGEALIAAFMAVHTDQDISSPVYKEKTKVAQHLAGIQAVIDGFLEVANGDKALIKEEANKVVEKAQNRLGKCEEQLIKALKSNEELTVISEGLGIQVGTLKSQTANLEELKTRLTEKETSLTTQIADLNNEAKQSRELKESVVGLEKNLAAKTSELLMINKDVERWELQCGSLTDQLEELKEAHDQAKIDLKITHDELREAKDRLNQQKVTLAESLSEMKATAAEEHGRLVGVVSSLEKELAKKEAVEEKALGL